MLKALTAIVFTVIIFLCLAFRSHEKAQDKDEWEREYFVCLEDLLIHQCKQLVKLQEKIDLGIDQISYLITWQEAQTKVLNELEYKLDMIAELLERPIPEVKDPGPSDKWW